MAAAPAIKKPAKFLTNKDLLAEIHKSKNSYSEYDDPKYGNYDFIVDDLDEITSERMMQARQKKLDDMISRKKKELVASGIKNPVIGFTLDDVPENGIVIRLMTFDHIPINPEKIDKAKTVSEAHIKCNFPPFQHFIMDNGQFRCVGKSHHKNGEFSITHGKMTNKLALMYIEMVERYGHRGNWRGYTYLDEMKSQALVQLSKVGLQFNESKQAIPNPFSYYTACMSTSFLKVLSLEKKNQNIRDDLLIMHGAMPSYTRQTSNELEQRAAADASELERKLARVEKAAQDLLKEQEVEQEEE